MPLSRRHRRLAAKHRRLVPFTIWRWFREYRFDPALWCAIWSAGWDGLLRACQRYNPSRGRLSTYAVAYIWGYAKKEIEKYYRRPVALRRPTRYGDLRSPENKPILLSDMFLDHREPLPSATTAHAALLDAAHLALQHFGPTDRFIIACHLGIDGQPEQTPAQIAARLGTSRVRVGQRYRRAMARFRKLMADFRPGVD